MNPLAHQQTNQQFSGVAAIRGAMMVMGSTYITYALGLLTSIIIARSLGPDDFGRYSYVVWLAGLLIMVGNNGLTASVIRFVSESLGRGSAGSARAVHGWLLRRQYACLALVALAFMLVIPFSMPAGWQGRAWVFGAVTLAAGLPKALFLFDVSVGKGYGHYEVEALSTVVMSVINVVAVLLLVATGAGLVSYMLLFAATSMGYAVSSRWLLRGSALLPARAAPDPAVLARLRPHLFWTVLLAIAYALSNKSIETYLLNAMVGPAAVGYFAIAGALTRGGIDMLSSGLTTVLMPMMAHAFGGGSRKRGGMIMASATRYFSFIGLLLAGVGALLAAPAITLLYGDAYTAVITPLRVMIVVGGLTLGEGALNALLSTTDNQRIRVVFVVLSVAVTATLAVLLIPRYGLMGAVVAHACSRLVVCAAVMAGVTRMTGLGLPWRELGRLLAAALVATAVAAVPMLAITGQWVGVVASVLYALTFVAATVAFGAWRRPDANQALAFLAQYPWLHARLGGPLRRWAAGLADGY